MTESSYSESTFPLKSKIPDWVLALGVSLLVSLAVLLPFFWLGSASGHDFEFHAASWLDVSQQWKEGTFYPRWTEWTNHGFGEPRYIFYPPFSWMLGAGLTRLVPLPWVPICFVLLVQTLAGTNAFFLLRRLVGRRGALWGAACYVANPNALLMTYVRSDFAEQFACAIFPLLFLQTLKLTDLLDERYPPPRSLLAFSIPFAAIWLCNAPAGVIASYSVALLIGWAALSERSIPVVLRGVAGIALGFGLISFYLVPAAYEQRWVNISQALSSGLLPWQNFLFTSIDDVEHTWFNWIASLCAVLLMLLLGATALISRKISVRDRSAGKPYQAWRALLLVGSAASLLMLRFTEPLWAHLPKLRFVQFPWRWMSIVALIYACFIAAVAEKRRGWLLPALILVLSVLLANFLVNNGWWDPDEMPTQKAAIESGAGYDGTDEYDPIGDDHMELPLNAPLVTVLREISGGEPVKNAEVKILNWTAEHKVIQIRTGEKASVAVRVLNYPAWRIEVNGKAVTPERMDDVDQMVLPVEAGSSLIEIRFTRTADRIAGNALSILSLGISVVVFYMGRKRAA
jgi:6-pyruvoyl-tetrahydropterin synthase related domain